MTYLKKLSVSTICGLGALCALSPAMAETEYSSFNLQSSVLTVPALSIDGTDTWLGDVLVHMNFSTHQFIVLDSRNIDAPAMDIIGVDETVNNRIIALENMVSPTITLLESNDIEERLAALEEVITSPISVEGSDLQTRIAALETILSPEIITANIQPGRYFAPSGNCFDLSGPFAFSETRSSYLLQECDGRGVMEILTGDTEDHPLMGERLADISLPTNRVYGVINTTPNNSSPTWYWNANSIIGLRQTGDFINMELYTGNAATTPSNGGDAELAYQTVLLTKEEE